MTDISTTTVSLQGMVTLNSVDANNTIWRINPDGLTAMGDPAPTIDVQPKTRQAGGWAGDSFDGSRYPTIAGTIRADTPTLLNAATDLLKAAVTNDEFTMTVNESGRIRTMSVRRAGETIITKISNRMAAYSIMVVALDPRLFGALMTASTAEFSSTGGKTVPFTVPFSINATVATGQVSLTNPGSKDGTVTMRVDGPCHGPIITHRGSGSALIFSSSLVLAVGEWLDIDMDAHTVLLNGQASRRGYVTSAGWSNFEPGVNVWSFSASSFDSGALLTVKATPAS